MQFLLLTFVPCEANGVRCPSRTVVIDSEKESEVDLDKCTFGGHVLTFNKFIEKITFLVVKACTDGVPRKGVIAGK